MRDLACGCGLARACSVSTQSNSVNASLDSQVASSSGQSTHFTRYWVPLRVQRCEHARWSRCQCVIARCAQARDSRRGTCAMISSISYSSSSTAPCLHAPACSACSTQPLTEHSPAQTRPCVWGAMLSGLSDCAAPRPGLGLEVVTVSLSYLPQISSGRDHGGARGVLGGVPCSAAAGR